MTNSGIFRWENGQLLAPDTVEVAEAGDIVSETNWGADVAGNELGDDATPPVTDFSSGSTDVCKCFSMILYKHKINIFYVNNFFLFYMIYSGAY